MTPNIDIGSFGAQAKTKAGSIEPRPVQVDRDQGPER